MSLLNTLYNQAMLENKLKKSYPNANQEDQEYYALLSALNQKLAGTSPGSDYSVGVDTSSGIGDQPGGGKTSGGLSPSDVNNLLAQSMQTQVNVPEFSWGGVAKAAVPGGVAGITGGVPGILGGLLMGGGKSVLSQVLAIAQAEGRNATIAESIAALKAMGVTGQDIEDSVNDPLALIVSQGNNGESGWGNSYGWGPGGDFLGTFGTSSGE
jgi:hypothetical protein